MDGGTVATQVMARADEGLPKMWTIHRALEVRRERPEVFGAEGVYVPLVVEGTKSEHVIAYLRGDKVATVVPRLTMKMAGAWRRTMVVLPEGRWRNRLTNDAVAGGRVAVEELLKRFPVALLVREEIAEGGGYA